LKVRRTPSVSTCETASTSAHTAKASGESRDHEIGERLVRIAVAHILEIWPSEQGVPTEADGVLKRSRSLPLNTFIEVLIRSAKISQNTLTLALHYLKKIEPEAKIALQSPVADAGQPTLPGQSEARRNGNPLVDGRRAFLSCLMLAHKYHNDRRCSNRTWSKITTLEAKELTYLEMNTLKLLNYNLFVSEDDFEAFLKSTISRDKLLDA
jgi:hypothetical protein